MISVNLKSVFKDAITNENVFVFPDPSHIIKLVRNTFGENVLLLIKMEGKFCGTTLKIYILCKRQKVYI